MSELDDGTNDGTNEPHDTAVAAAAAAAMKASPQEEEETFGSDLEKAQDLRLQGNHLFRQQAEFLGATSYYTQAIDLLKTLQPQQQDEVTTNDDELILNYCNRSACHLILNQAEEARQDALQAWELSRQTSAKAAYRLVKAYLVLRETSAAKVLLQKILQKGPQSTTADSLSSSPSPPISLTDDEIKSFQDLWNQLLDNALTKQQHEQAAQAETTVRFAQRPVSIREFTQQTELGFGNFSEIRVVTHKVTDERFALKKIPKKQAADLAKRQHPNVYNEIQMERRALLERLPPTCPFVIQMYHAFSDYEHLYYLMELHDQWTDLWTQLRWKPAEQLQQLQQGNGDNNNNNNNSHVSTYMVGCHRSQGKVWLYQLVLALEHLHRHGIVHRDIKAENILLNRHGHLILIDFGTAKDLVERDLNGPEFVGTPDFMSPEAVTGDASMKPVVEADEQDKTASQKLGAATWCADLWALGALSYIMDTGMTPFWTTSPYLAFLRIQRALTTRPWGIVDNDAWDFKRRLLQLQPTERLGADTFEVVVETVGEDEKEEDTDVKQDETKDKKTPQRKKTYTIVERDPEHKGYTALKEHPFMALIHQQYTTDPSFPRKTPVPSLRDLCYRAVALMAVQDVDDIDLCEAHPPGCGSSHDLTRLEGRDRKAVLHLLDRQKLLGKEPRLWSRFFINGAEARLEGRIRPDTRDVVGLTQMNDDQGKAPQAAVEQSQFERKSNDPLEMLEFVQICSPLLMERTANPNADEEEAWRKAQTKLFRKCVARINKIRPKLVLVCSQVTVDAACRKLLARINESIPVVLHEAKATDDASSAPQKQEFFSFWLSGIQGVCLSYPLACVTDDNADEANKAKRDQQLAWVREQMELVRMSKHPFFCFVNGPIHSGDFPLYLLKRLARGRALAMFSPLATEKSDKKTKRAGMKLQYHANEKIGRGATWIPEKDEETAPSNDDDGNVSIKSTDSVEDDGDDFETIIDSSSCAETGLRWIRVDPIHADEWSHSMDWVGE
mmetsp:Transcript_17573/g.41308  ORF Transcript_17573/g.41308 Transcript_17573/m.41308 type:complete len:1011 (-) Transcript_17573:279-3311(-)